VQSRSIKTVLALAPLLLSLGGSGCGSNTAGTGGGAGGTTATTGPLNAADFGQKYKFSATDIAGWQQDPSDPGAYVTYTGGELVQSIDGAAGIYTDKGAMVMMYQSLVGPDPQIAVVWAMEFGTEALAAAMVDWERTDKTATVSIPGYSNSVAIGYGTISGFTVYAHVKTSYFEVQLSGLGDQTSTCSECPVAAKFLDILSSKTN
jgi:hypothetical protein